MATDRTSTRDGNPAPAVASSPPASPRTSPSGRHVFTDAQRAKSMETRRARGPYRLSLTAEERRQRSERSRAAWASLSPEERSRRTRPGRLAIARRVLAEIASSGEDEGAA